MNTIETTVLFESVQVAKMDALGDAIAALVTAEMAYKYDYVPQARKSRVYADSKRAYHAMLGMEQFLQAGTESMFSSDIDWSMIL